MAAHPEFTRQGSSLTSVLKPEQRTNINANVEQYESIVERLASSPVPFPELVTFPEDDLAVNYVEKASRYAQASVTVRVLLEFEMEVIFIVFFWIRTKF